jgi:hypothetical protein
MKAMLMDEEEIIIAVLVLCFFIALPLTGAVAVYWFLSPTTFWERVVALLISILVGAIISIVEFIVASALLD